MIFFIKAGTTFKTGIKHVHSQKVITIKLP